MQSDYNRAILSYLDANKPLKAQILYKARAWELHKQLMVLIEKSVPELQVNSIEDLEALARSSQILQEN